MSAKDLFKKLGYECRTPRVNYGIPNEIYVKKTMSNSIRTISFDKAGKYIDITEKYQDIIEEGYENYNYLDLEELQAINKQVEELGWNER